MPSLIFFDVTLFHARVSTSIESSSGQSDSPSFGPSRDVFFRATDGKSNYLFRKKYDGSGRQRVLADPILHFRGIPPDGKRVAIQTTVAGSGEVAMLAFPLDGGPPQHIDWEAQWYRNSKRLLASLRSKSMGSPALYAVRLRTNGAPPLPLSEEALDLFGSQSGRSLANSCRTRSVDLCICSPDGPT